MRFRSMIGQLLLAQVAAFCWIFEAHAQIRDPEMAFDSAHSEIMVEANGATLGEILDRLFTERGIPVEWRDKALAGKVMQGSFKGPIDRVAQRLLSGENYIAVSAMSDGETRITRVIILGGASPKQIAPPRLAIAHALPRAPARPGIAPSKPAEVHAIRWPPAPPGIPPKASRAQRKIYR